MKAICVREFGSPDVLKLEDLPDHRPPQSGEEVLIRVKAAGVNPYDTYMRSGAYGSGNPALPFTPGSDAAGVVESVGADIDLAPGPIHATLQAGLGNGTLRPVVASEWPLASAPEAHRRIMEPGAWGKIVLIP
ncbi:MAG: zinc-binding dehydrogenase [Candidatus Sulfotelmatobacter sp.]